jgi:hypothetical protein
MTICRLATEPRSAARKSFRAAWPSGLLILGLLTACTDSKPGQSDAVVPRWHGTADLTIGSLDGTHDQFGAISGIATDRAGRIFIADGDNNAIAVFDSTGRYLFNIGREGSGPGELRGPCCLLIDEAGRLWVRDMFNRRYNLYSLSESGAALVGTRKMSPGAGGLWSPVTFDRGGQLVDVVVVPTEKGMQLHRYHVDSLGSASAVDTIVAPPNDSMGIHQFSVGNGIGFINQPYGPRFVVAQAPGGDWARGLSSRYLVSWVRAGDSVRTIRRDMIGPALSARERQEADSLFRKEAQDAGQGVNSIPFGVPGSKPPVRALYFDRQGRLWVQLSVADGENNRADVWDSTGRRVGNAEWPAGVELRQGLIDDKVAYGIQQDSVGVPQVVRLRFR